MVSQLQRIGLEAGGETNRDTDDEEQEDDDSTDINQRTQASRNLRGSGNYTDDGTEGGYTARDALNDLAPWQSERQKADPSGANDVDAGDDITQRTDASRRLRGSGNYTGADRTRPDGQQRNDPSGSNDVDGSGLNLTPEEEMAMSSSAGGGKGPRMDDQSAGEVVTEDDEGNLTVIGGETLDTVLDPFRSEETRKNNVVAEEGESVTGVIDAVLNGGSADLTTAADPDPSGANDPENPDESEQPLPENQRPPWAQAPPGGPGVGPPQGVPGQGPPGARGPPGSSSDGGGVLGSTAGKVAVGGAGVATTVGIAWYFGLL